ncbi:MAG: hypothetical protein ACRD4V_08095 [Candidatus Acidiferrales bacterium]
MAETQDPHGKQQKVSRYEENVPSSKVLKLAIVAALIIVIIGLALYLKARHQPPALRDQLQMTPVRAAPRQLRYAKLSTTQAPQETAWRTRQQAANQILS